jgi:hypothetical protein
VTDGRRRQLIRDLAGLVAKYGIDEFKFLLSEAGRIELVQEATSVIAKLEDQGLPHKPARRSRPTRIAKPDPLHALRTVDPHGAEQLALAQTTLLNGPFFRARSELRLLAHSMGMREDLNADRRITVRQLITFASKLPESARAEFIARVLAGRREVDQTFADWAKTIMGSERNGPAHDRREQP